MKDKTIAALLNALKNMMFWQNEVNKQMLLMVEDEMNRRINEAEYNNQEPREFC